MSMFFKKLAILASSVLIAVSVAACSSGSTSKLVGQWERINTEETRAEFDELEFFSDGSYSSDDANYNGNYSIDGSRIKLTGILVEPISCSFDISGDNLTLTVDEKTWEYKKLN